MSRFTLASSLEPTLTSRSTNLEQIHDKAHPAVDLDVPNATSLFPFMTGMLHPCWQAPELNDGVFCADTGCGTPCRLLLTCSASSAAAVVSALARTLAVPRSDLASMRTRCEM